VFNFFLGCKVPQERHKWGCCG